MKLSLSEVEQRYGKELAEQASKMRAGETQEFYYVCYQAVVITCKTPLEEYYILEQHAVEECLEDGIDDDDGIEM